MSHDATETGPLRTPADDQLRRTYAALRIAWSELSSVRLILESCAEEPVSPEDAASVVEGIAKCVQEAQRAWHEVAPAAWLDTRIHKYAFASALTELLDELRAGEAAALTGPRHLASMRTQVSIWLEQIDTGYERFCKLHPGAR